MKNKKVDLEKLIKEKQTVYENVTVKEISIDENEEGILEAVVATDETDRDGERLDIASLDVETYMKNNIVAWSHDYKKLSIAKTLEIRKEMKNGVQVLIAKMKFAVNESPFAKEVYSLYKNGFMKAFSIGFIPKQYDLDTNKWMNSEMIEYSAVLIGSNRNALVEAKSKGFEVDEIEKQIDIVDKENKVCDNNISKDEQKPKVTESPEDQTETQDHQEKIIEKKKESKKMLILKDILAKEVSQVTLEEAEFICFKQADLTAEEKEKFKSLFKNEVVEKELADLKAKMALPRDTKNVNNGNVAADEKKVLSKEIHTVLWLKGVIDGNNFAELKAKTAAGYMNTTDESAIVPPAEFIADVLRLEREFGVARKYAGIRTLTMSNSIELTLGDQSVTVVEVGEAVAAPASKNTYSPITVNVKKMMGYALVTDELNEDSAIDIYGDLVNRFARAFAEKEDQKIFTDATTGIINQVGVHDFYIGTTTAESMSWTVLNRAMYGVTGSIKDGAWFMNTTMIGVVSRLKDENNRPLFIVDPTGEFAGRIFNRPVVETEVLPEWNADGQTEDEALMVYGNLKNAILVDKTGMETKVFESGIVPDSDDVDFNLITQGGTVLRAKKRFNAQTVFPQGFSIVRAGTEGS